MKRRPFRSKWLTGCRRHSALHPKHGLACSWPLTLPSRATSNKKSRSSASLPYSAGDGVVRHSVRRDGLSSALNREGRALASRRHSRERRDLRQRQRTDRSLWLALPHGSRQQSRRHRHLAHRKPIGYARPKGPRLFASNVSATINRVAGFIGAARPSAVGRSPSIRSEKDSRVRLDAYTLFARGRFSAGAGGYRHRLVNPYRGRSPGKLSSTYRNSLRHPGQYPTVNGDLKIVSKGRSP